MDTRQRPRTGIVLRGSTIGIGLGLLVALAVAVVWGLSSIKVNFSGFTSESKPAANPESVRLPEVISQRQKTYAQLPAMPKAPPAPEPHTGTAKANTPPSATAKQTTNPFVTQPAATAAPPPQPGNPAPLPAVSTSPQTMQGQGTTPIRTTTPVVRATQGTTPPGQPGHSPQGKGKSTNWLKKTFTTIPDDDEDTDPPPRRRSRGEHSGPGDEKSPGSRREQAQALFPQAVWATPADPTRILYSSQRVHGLLLHAINTDIPGDIVVIVTEPVEDKMMQGHTLIPQYSVMLGSQDGQIKYGQARIPGKFRKIEFPDGTDVSFEGQGGDRTGATGIPGKVDNHWPQVILGAGISAVLNIGTQMSFGNTQGYNPTLEQQFAREFGQGLNQAGQAIVRRELQRNPTITQQYGYPVTINFKDNISFMSSPIIVRK